MKGSEGAAKGQDNQEHEECRAAWAAWPGRDAGMEWTTTNSTLLTGQWLTGVKKRAKIKNVRIAKQEGIWIVMNRHTKRGWEQSNEPLWNENSARSGDDHPACQSWGRRKIWEKYSQTCGCGALHKLQSYINILRVGLCGFDVARVWCLIARCPGRWSCQQHSWPGPGSNWQATGMASQVEAGYLLVVYLYVYKNVYIYICVCVCEHDWAESHG